MIAMCGILKHLEQYKFRMKIFRTQFINTEAKILEIISINCKGYLFKNSLSKVNLLKLY